MEPTIVERPAQPYVGILRSITMTTFPEIADRLPGVLPAGRYVRTTHHGHPQELLGVTADMLTWAARQGLRFDKSDTDEGEAWGSRLEFYLTDPAVEPDMNNWEHELLFKLAQA